MNETLTRKLDDYTRQSHAGELLFPDFIGKLAELGIERYHTDYCRHENTYYGTDETSHVVAVSYSAGEIGIEFGANALATAVRQSQRNEHSYQDFVRKTMAAGCVGYFVQITGRQVLYFGRKGEIHIEPFPAAPQD